MISCADSSRSLPAAKWMNPWLQHWNVVFGLFEKAYKAMLALLFISAGLTVCSGR
jgi:hypothetical protein